MQKNTGPYVPSLVFIETTKACEYSCRHCRAESQSEPLPDELTTAELKNALDQIRGLSDSPPEIVITGGDFLLRKDIREIISYASSIGLPFSASPAGSPLLTGDFMEFLRSRGVRSMSLSLDGIEGGTHDWLRRIPGSFNLTLNLLIEAKKVGINAQVNTTVIKRNIMELPTLVSILKDLGISTWEVFFLIKTGRGIKVQDISPDEYMQINRWLADLRDYGINVRTVEGPVLRVIKKIQEVQPEAVGTDLYQELTRATVDLLGLPDRVKPASYSAPPVRHFRGTLFIGYNGDVYPSGLFTAKLGSLRRSSLSSIISEGLDYLDPRNSGRLEGRCGKCQFREMCGGSRARALAYTGNPFAEDPACLYVPELKVGEVEGRQL
ncbi:MAG: radical SAM protein [Thermoplasmataceae archaeon]